MHDSKDGLEDELLVSDVRRTYKLVFLNQELDQVYVYVFGVNTNYYVHYYNYDFLVCLFAIVMEAHHVFAIEVNHSPQ